MDKGDKPRGLRLAAVSDEPVEQAKGPRAVFDGLKETVFPDVARMIEGRSGTSGTGWCLAVPAGHLDEFKQFLSEDCGLRVSFDEFFADGVEKNGMIAVRIVEHYDGWKMIVGPAEKCKRDDGYQQGTDFYLFEAKNFPTENIYYDQKFWVIKDMVAKEYGPDAEIVKAVDRAVEITRELLFKTLDADKRFEMAKELQVLAMKFKAAVSAVVADFIEHFAMLLNSGNFDEFIIENDLDPDSFAEARLRVRKGKGVVDLEKLAE